MYQRQVTFGEAINQAFSQYCQFTGRASRSEYWWFVLFTFIVCTVLNLSTFVVGKMVSQALTTIFGLATLFPSLGLCVRRLHDTGRSGWYYGIMLILMIPFTIFATLNTSYMLSCHDTSTPLLTGLIITSLLMFVGFIMLLVFFCKPSQEGDNKYGPMPNIEES